MEICEKLEKLCDLAFSASTADTYGQLGTNPQILYSKMFLIFAIEYQTKVQL